MRQHKTGRLLAGLVAVLVVLVGPGCSARQPIDRGPTGGSFDAQTTKLFGGSLVSRQLHYADNTVFAAVEVNGPAPTKNGYELLVWARSAYPQSKQVRVSISWPNWWVSRTADSYNWDIVPGDGASKPVIYHARRLLASSVWVSGESTLSASQIPTSTGTLFLLSTTTPIDRGGRDVLGFAPQILVTGASESWVAAVASGAVPEPTFPAPQGPLNN